MARASTKTLMSLDRFAQLLGIDPLHFNQIQLPTAIRAARTCANPWKQWAWQESGQVGREDVAQAIAEAEAMIAEHVGYTLLPDWQVDERVRVTLPGASYLFNVGARDTRGYWPSQHTRWAKIISGGIEDKNPIADGIGTAVEYIDQDLDGYFETARIVFTTDVTEPDDLAVYYPGESGRDEWEIRPLNDPMTNRRSVTISAGTATILMARSQLVDPDLMEAIVPTSVNGVDGDFLATVDVYEHVNDPQTQVQLMWAPTPDLCDCGSTTCPTCAHATQYGCLVAKDYDRGSFFFRPATWDSDEEAFAAASFAVARVPENLRMWYYAGNRDMSRDAPNLEMERKWELPVAYLALTILDRPLCGCSNLDSLVRHWREDQALQSSNSAGSMSWQLSTGILDNPWGSLRGAIFAWRRANAENAVVGRAVAL